MTNAVYKIPKVRLNCMDRATDSRPYEFCFESFISGHHVDKREPENSDKNAVKVFKGEDVVGHIPKHLPKTCNYIHLAGGRVSAQVTGHHQNKRTV